jgi:hypothetical protein
VKETEKGRQLKETQPLFLFTKGERLCSIGLKQKLWGWIKATKGFLFHLQILDQQNKRVISNRTMGQMLALQVFNIPNKLIGPSRTHEPPIGLELSLLCWPVIGSQITAPHKVDGRGKKKEAPRADFLTPSKRGLEERNQKTIPLSRPPLTVHGNKSRKMKVALGVSCHWTNSNQPTPC